MIFIIASARNDANAYSIIFALKIASAQMSNKLEKDLVLPLVSGVKYNPKHLLASFVISKQYELFIFFIRLIAKDDLPLPLPT